MTTREKIMAIIRDRYASYDDAHLMMVLAALLEEKSRDLGEEPVEIFESRLEDRVCGDSIEALMAGNHGDYEDHFNPDSGAI